MVYKHTIWNNIYVLKDLNTLPPFKHYVTSGAWNTQLYLKDEKLKYMTKSSHFPPFLNQNPPHHFVVDICAGHGLCTYVHNWSSMVTAIWQHLRMYQNLSFVLYIFVNSRFLNGVAHFSTTQELAQLNRAATMLAHLFWRHLSVVCVSVRLSFMFRSTFL